MYISFGVYFVVFLQEIKKRWLSKKPQMQGAQILRNEAYSGTPQ
jgi:hypothetical protein